MIRDSMVALAAVAGAAALVNGNMPIGGERLSAPQAPFFRERSGPNDFTSLAPDPQAPPIDAATSQCLKSFAAIGTPRSASEDTGAAQQYICRPGYALALNLRTCNPDWVIEHVLRAQLNGPGDRNKSAFREDPLLITACGRLLDDYARSGYDRGHQAPAADFKSEQMLTDDSFYMSNMAPQVGLGFNRGEWAYLEGAVREALRCGGASELFIITGPIFGSGQPKVIGSDRVAVPNAFFKIAYDPTQRVAVGFVLPNQKLPREDVSVHVRKISEIEDLTGLNFFASLPRRAQNLLKNNPGILRRGDPGCAGHDT